MMEGVLIEAHFLPSVEYFCALASHDTVVLEAHEHFVKQSYRNRCYILASHGPERLTVPLKEKHGKVFITSVKIDYSYRWQTNFWRTVQSAYAKAPFFEHYQDDLHRELFSNEPSLFSLNRRLLSMCLNWLDWRKEVTISPSYEHDTNMEDLRNTISAKADYSHRTFFRPVGYSQVFGKTFVPNLSILDLVCCAGPDAGRIILESAGALNK
jgi:hypothetical protein